MNTMTTTSSTAEREIYIERTFQAPRSLVWDAWTKPEHILHWWGPTGFTNTSHEMDVRPGGVWKFIMHGPDDTDFPNKIIFSAVDKPERLEFMHGDDIEGGNYFDVIVTFQESDGKTTLSMRMIFKTKEERDLVVEQYGAIEGNKQTMDKLEAYLKQGI